MAAMAPTDWTIEVPPVSSHASTWSPLSAFASASHRHTFPLILLLLLLSSLVVFFISEQSRRNPDGALATPEGKWYSLGGARERQNPSPSSSQLNPQNMPPAGPSLAPTAPTSSRLGTTTLLYLPAATPANLTKALEYVQEPQITFDYGRTDFNYTHSASVCVAQHHYDPRAYLTFNQTTLHIIWQIWLPSNQHGRKIVLGQLYHLTAPGGLLYRPYTKLYIVLVTQSEEEEAWFFSLNVIKRPPVELTIFLTTDNAYEFWGVRWLWELGCAHPDDLYLYFHSKGARYGRDHPKYLGTRLRGEILLSRQTLRPWRSIMTLLASTTQPTITWTGGKNNNWYNFLWVRGSYLQLLMKPVRTLDRYWYELWNGMRIEQSQCDGSYYLMQATKESMVNTSLAPFKAGAGSTWKWYPKSFYATKECKEWSGNQHYMMVSMYEQKWTAPECKGTPGKYFCSLKERDPFTGD